jgi:hypothetical protein
MELALDAKIDGSLSIEKKRKTFVKRLTRDLKDHQKNMNAVAKEMYALKLTLPENRPAPKSPKLDPTFIKAKKMSAEFGNVSKEARLAWEGVEEIASWFGKCHGRGHDY